MATTKIQTFPGDVEVTSNLTVNTNTLRVDTINNKVGIGVASPTSDLHIAGSVATGDDFTVTNTAGTQTNLQVDVSTGEVGFGESPGTYRFRVQADTDVTAIFGKCRVGYIDNDTDWAAWGHIDNTGTNQWALVQSQSGATLINNIGQRTEIREAGTIKHIIQGTNLDNAKIGFNTDLVSGTHRVYVNGLMRTNHPYGRASRTTSFALGSSSTTIDWGGMDSNETNRITYNNTYDGITIPVKGIYEVTFYVNTYSSGVSARGYDIFLRVNDDNLNAANYAVYSTHGYKYINTNTYEVHQLSWVHQFEEDDVIGVQVEGNSEAAGIFAYNKLFAILLHPT